jgi:hypothetical protein
MLAYKYTLTNNFTGESVEINAAFDSGGACQSIDGRSDGYRLTEYPVFELDVRNEEEDKTGQHGIFDFFSFYGKLDITFEGVLFAESHKMLVQMQERLRRIVALPAQPIQGVNDGYINISWEDALGITWQVNAKIQEDIEFKRNVGVQTESSFFLNMKASDPRILSGDQNQQDTLLGWRQSKFTIPAFLPNNINFNFENQICIYQAGTGDAPWTAKLFGPTTNPKITKFTEVIDYDLLVSDFTTGWIGGVEETLIFQTSGLARRLTSTAGAIDSMTLTGALDLSLGQFITFYLYIDDITKMDTTDNVIRFSENVGTDYFEIAFDYANPTLRTGWNYFYLLCDEFEITGTPSWNNITEVKLSIKATTSNNLSVVFDDMHNRTITYTENKMELALSLGVGEYVDIDINNGTLLKNGNQDVSGYITFDSDFFYLPPKQNILLYESTSDPNITWEYPTQPVEFYWYDVLL